MSPYPSPSDSISGPISTATSSKSSISSDGRLKTAIIVLSILAAILVVCIVYITLRAKRRQSLSDRTGPYQGTVIHRDHPAAEIVPFGNSHFGANGPRYKRTPGEDMRIAVRRPDGAWHFTDSRTPFTPSGVKDLDNVPSLKPSSASILSSSSDGRISSKKADEVKMERLRRRQDAYLDFDLSPTVPPPPAYHPDGSQDHSEWPNSPST